MYIYISVCICICIYIYIYICLHTCMYMYMYMYIHVYLHTCIYMYIYMYVIGMYIYNIYFVYIYIYICILKTSVRSLKYELNVVLTLGIIKAAAAESVSATHCNTLQHAATLYNTLQHSAVHCNAQMLRRCSQCRSRILKRQRALHFLIKNDSSADLRNFQKGCGGGVSVYMSMYVYSNVRI